MIILERFCDHNHEPPMGCLGEIYIGGEFFCNTIEQSWRDNRRFVSCVPVGEYTLERYVSDKYGEVVALVNHDLGVYARKHEVTDGDRYACLFHAANWSSQLQGCIAPGEALAWGQRSEKFAPNVMVTNSRVMLKDFLAEVKDDNRLLIRWRH